MPRRLAWVFALAASSAWAAPDEAPAPAPPTVQTLANAEVIHGMPLPAGSRVTWRPEQGVLLRATPPSDVTWWGLPVLGDTEVRFDVGVEADVGKLRSLTLSEDTDVLGLPLRAGSAIVVACADAACPDAASSLTDVRAGTLSKRFRVGDHKWPAGTYVVRGATGELTSAQLPHSDVLKVDGVKLSSLTGITFHPGGALRSGTLAADTKLGDVRAKGGREVEWDQGGAPVRLTLADEAELSGHLVPAGAGVGLYPSGALRFVATTTPATLAGMPLGPKTAGVEFHENGRVASIVTEEDFTYQGVTVDGELGYRVVFDEGGVLRVARLGAPLTVNGTTFETGAWIQVDDDGTVREVGPGEVMDR